MDLKKLFLATVIIWIVGTLFAMLTCGWLFNWVYLIPPLIWKSTEEMMSLPNMIGSAGFGFVSSIVFAWVYTIIKKAVPGKGLSKGANYGIIVWSVGAFAGNITLPFFMTISPIVVAYWIIQSLALSIINGVIVQKVFS